MTHSSAVATWLAALLVPFVFPACATAHTRANREAKYESCVHQAHEAVSDGWVCVEDGQIAGARFSGHVAFEDRAGLLIPLQDVQLWRAEAQSLASGRPLAQVDIEVSPDGWFSFPQLVTYTQSLQKRNGHFVARDRMDDYVFVLRAKGCQDYTVHWRPDDPDPTIIMNCASRVEAEIGQAK
jgi:hypothetical protein